jgi:hypothetical protein
VNITVDDLIQYLTQFDPTTEVGLDHDGWMEDECGVPTPTAQDIIHMRGLFYVSQWEGKQYITINN